MGKAPHLKYLFREPCHQFQFVGKSRIVSKPRVSLATNAYPSRAEKSHFCFQAISCVPFRKVESSTVVPGDVRRKIFPRLLVRGPARAASYFNTRQVIFTICRGRGLSERLELLRKRETSG